MRTIFIDAETGAVGGQLEEHAVGLTKVNRLKPKTIDHRRRMRAVLHEERRLH